MGKWLLKYSYREAGSTSSYPARMHKCKVIDILAAKKILRWRELAPSRTSEHIRSIEDTPILLVPATGLTRFYSWRFQLFSCPFGSHFIYGHESRPQLTCHVFTYIHAHPQHLTLHSGCGVQ